MISVEQQQQIAEVIKFHRGLTGMQGEFHDGTYFTATEVALALSTILNLDKEAFLKLCGVEE